MKDETRLWLTYAEEKLEQFADWKAGVQRVDIAERVIVDIRGQL